MFKKFFSRKSRKAAHGVAKKNSLVYTNDKGWSGIWEYDIWVVKRTRDGAYNIEYMFNDRDFGKAREFAKSIGGYAFSNPRIA